MPPSVPDPAHARVLDARGMFCPVPIIETAKAVKTMATGEVLLVRGTDPGIESDMPAWCKSTRHELVELRREGAELRAWVRKAHG